MTEQLKQQSLENRPALYRIRVCGRLDSERSKSLQGMTVSLNQSEHGPTCTELYGPLPDQAALIGVLQDLYNLSIPLCNVECVSEEPATENSFPPTVDFLKPRQK